MSIDADASAGSNARHAARYRGHASFWDIEDPQGQTYVAVPRRQHPEAMRQSWADDRPHMCPCNSDRKGSAFPRSGDGKAFHRSCNTKAALAWHRIYVPTPAKADHQ